MSTLNLALLFLDEGFQGSPIAHLQVKFSTGGQIDEKHYDRLITCECLSPSEFDNEIDRLQAELERVRLEGKKKFAKAQGKARTASSSGFRSAPRKAS